MTLDTRFVTLLADWRAQARQFHEAGQDELEALVVRCIREVEAAIAAPLPGTTEGFGRRRSDAILVHQLADRRARAQRFRALGDEEAAAREEQVAVLVEQRIKRMRLR